MRVFVAVPLPDDDGLEELHGRIDRGLAELGFKREKRGFHAHITLGRVKSGEGKRPLVEEIEAREEMELGRLPVEEFHLYESDLTPQGARYTVLSSYRLGG